MSWDKIYSIDLTEDQMTDIMDALLEVIYEQQEKYRHLPNVKYAQRQRAIYKLLSDKLGD